MLEYKKMSSQSCGHKFTLGVFENKSKGNIQRIGYYKGNTAGHRGYDSDAWSIIRKEFPKLEKQAKKCIDNDEYNNAVEYWDSRWEQKMGIKLHELR